MGVRGGVRPFRPSSAARASRARVSRIDAAFGVHPSSTAMSPTVNPSQARIINGSLWSLLTHAQIRSARLRLVLVGHAHV